MKSIFISALTLLFLVGCDTQKPDTPEHRRVVKIFQSSEEPTATDAVWTAYDLLKVGVCDNGTNRDGYAGYVCQVLYEHGFRGKKVLVHVIDIAALTRNNQWKKLGTADCE